MVFLGGWRSRYLYQQGCPMLPATVARGYVAFSRHGKKISKTNKKHTTYNIPHCTNFFLLELLLFFFPIFFVEQFSAYFFLFLFFISYFPLSICFFFFEDPRREEQRNTGRSGGCRRRSIGLTVIVL